MAGSELSTRALRVAPRWTLFAAGFLVAFLIVGFSVGFVDSAPSALSDNAKVLTGPSYQAFAALDGLAWIVIGATIWILAMMAQPTAALRARLAALSGVAIAVLGSLGGFIRLTLVPYLASQYIGASSTQQATVVVDFHTVQGLFGAAFTAGQFFQVTGFLFVASALLTIPGFPRWLAGWAAFPAATAGVLFIIDLLFPLTQPDFFGPILIVHIIIGTLGLFIALTIKLWKFQPAPRAPAGPISAV